MPLPKPGEKENQDEFVSRCMSELKDEFTDQPQRLAVCFKQWKDKDKEKDSLDDFQIEHMVMPQSELRIIDGEQPKLAGYAAVFNALSEEFFGMREKISQGAFLDSIKQDDVRMLWNHDPNYVLARNKNGTLRLWEDDRGLAFEATPIDTQWAKDLVKSIKRGDVSQNSFGFVVLDHEYDSQKQIRTLKQVRLYDISPVTFPAYPQTEIHLRSGFNERKIPLDELGSEQKRELRRIYRHHQDHKVKSAHQYFGEKGIYSAGDPNPMVVIPKDDKDGDTIIVEPKIPLIDQARYLTTKNKIRRFTDGN